MRKFTMAAIVAVGLASFGAQAEEVVAPVADATAVAAAQLDTTVAPATAAAGFSFASMFASKAVVTGLIFAGVSVATFVATTNGDAQGVVIPGPPEH